MLLTSRSPPLRPSDPKCVAGSAMLRDTLKRTAKSSRHSKTRRKVHFHRKLGPKQPQTKETKRRKRSPNPLVPLKHTSDAQRRKHLANRQITWTRDGCIAIYSKHDILPKRLLGDGLLGNHDTGIPRRTRS